MMKKWFRFAFALLLLLCVLPFAGAEQAQTYQLGDRMDDFSVTLSDGTEVSLYGLLKEKKAVLINFWASWCSPCKREFPEMERAYEEMRDEIGIIALSCERADTDEKVLALKQDLGLDSLMMGLDTDRVVDRFTLMGYPTSVLVDRYGVICFLHAGSIPDRDKFIRLFTLYTGDDYTASAPIQEIPLAKPDVAQPPAEAVLAALGAQDDRFSVAPLEDDTTWPFAPSEDGACVQATNAAAKDSTARLLLHVEAEAGEAFAFEYAVSCPAALDSLTVTVDGQLAKYYGGDVDWTSDYAPFATSGAHTIEIAFVRGLSLAETAVASLRNVSVLTAEQVAALDAQAPQRPKTLSGVACDIEPIGDNIKPILLTENSQAGGEREQAMTIVTGGSLTLRVKIGTEVDEHVAYIASNDSATLLVNLPYDDEGFLYQAGVAGLADGNAYPYQTFVACTSAVNRMNSYMKTHTCFASEADVDAYIQMNTEMAVAAGMTDYQMSWAYADGSPKQGGVPTAAALPDGMAEYRICVTDEAGAPLSGAMIQICDLDTCMVAVTDENGLATHVATPYPYEIHLLKAPDGYAPDTETHVMPEEGGELTIILQKQ